MQEEEEESEKKPDFDFKQYDPSLVMQLGRPPVSG